jgi:predicted metal-dependent peptidase
MVTKQEQMTGAERISKAIIKLLGSADTRKRTGSEQPFFARLLMDAEYKQVPAERDEQGKLKHRMSVDAKGNIYYCEEFVQEITQEELMGCLCHECLHPALLHLTRLGYRNAEIANIAMDMTINMIVRNAQLQLPEDVIQVDTRDDTSTFQVGPQKYTLNKVTERMWEDLYDEILERLIQDGHVGKGGSTAGGQGGKIPKGFDDHRYDDGEMTREEREKNERKWQKKITDAYVYAKQQGRAPAGLDRYLDDVLQPKVRYADLLKRFLKPYFIPVDWSYHKPHRKSQVLGVFLPSTIKEHVECEVLMDTSGSVGVEELSEFGGEVVGIATSNPHVTCHVSFCDREVHNRIKVDTNLVQLIPSQIREKAKGGGGTSMETGLDYIKQVNPRVPVVIVLTDGYDTYVRNGRDYPFEIIWVIAPKGQKNMPYGQVVSMET